MIGKEFYNICDGKEEIVVDQKGLKEFRDFIFDHEDPFFSNISIKIDESIFKHSLYGTEFAKYQNRLSVIPSGTRMSFGTVAVSSFGSPASTFILLRKEKSKRLTEFDLMVQKHRNDIAFLIMSTTTQIYIHQQDAYTENGVGIKYYRSIPIALSEAVEPGLIIPVYKK